MFFLVDFYHKFPYQSDPEYIEREMLSFWQIDNIFVSVVQKPYVT